jgi:DNA-binding CsgD family transcriptional regulator
MEKRVNLLFIFFAASVAIVNSILALVRNDFHFSSLVNSAIYIPLVGAFFFIVIQKSQIQVLRISHILFLAVVSSIAILDNYSSIFGLGFALIGMYLAQKYGFFIRRTVTKAVLSLIAIVVLVEISALAGDESGSGIDVALFVFFFFAVFYFGDRETLLRYKEQEEALKERIRKEFGSGVDLKKMGFTEREIEVGAVLCQTLGTDKEIAYDLNISKNTVINHLRSMRDKADVRDRQHLIEAIRGYYISKDVESGD